jgi:GNAT superfamily N-acetyltransferase
MRIRPVVSEDREFVIGLSARFAESSLPAWRPAESIVSGTARHLEAALASPGPRSAIFIAVDDEGAKLGFSWVFLTKDFFTGTDVAKISEIATARDGTGAGTALMAASEAWARERGCEIVVLNVLRANERARAFYERLGYEPEYTAMAKPLSRQAPDEPG